MRLLFIKLKHIGDSLLLTPTLMAVRQQHRDAQIWVVVRRGCEGIMEGCPAIDRVLTAAAPERSGRSMRDLWSACKLVDELRREKFDYAFELSDGDRGRFLAWLSGARHHCTNDAAEPLSRWWKGRFDRTSSFEWWTRHRVEKDFHTVGDFISLPSEIPPLTFVKDRTQGWPPGDGLDRFVVMHPATRWARKAWPVERWIEAARAIVARGFKVVVSFGPLSVEVDLANEIVQAVGGMALSTRGQLSWAQLAGLLHRARLFVGVDTAAMHLAAACQCPTVALFGPSKTHEWSPWQVKHRILAPPADAKQNTPEEGWMRLIAAKDVIDACEALLQSSS